MRWYVTSKKSNDTRDGRSLDTAFRRILHAIHMAGPDDTIVIEPGVYDQDLAKRIGVLTDMGGPQATLTPAESVRALRRLISTVGPAQSGKFFNYDGREYAW